MPANNAASETQWPPRSPGQAMLLTPEGREKYRRMLDRGQSPPSPSPSRARPPMLLDTLSPRRKKVERQTSQMEMDSDDDEETLQLKLQQIETQLRLKKLRKAKLAGVVENASPTTSPQKAENGHTHGLQPAFAPQATHTAHDRRLQKRREELEEAETQGGVQIPASPVRKAMLSGDVHKSPSRVLLGIDKGIGAGNMSLKRAPSLRKQGASSRAGNEDGTFLRRTRTPQPETEPAAKPMSFSEKLALARNEEATRSEKQHKAKQQRSSGFDVGRDEMEGYKQAAVVIPDSTGQNGFSRHQLMSSLGRDQPSRNDKRARSPPKPLTAADDVFQSPSRREQSALLTPDTSNSDAAGSQPSSYEAYSGFHLSKRILPLSTLARSVKGKTIYNLKDLLRHVKAPSWSLPDDVVDIVLFAIIASKSDPKSHKPQWDPKTRQEKPSDRGKFMVITLVDLQWEVDLYLFDTGFERFWKLDVGTVIAILNPTIMPPPPGRADTGKFSIVINSDADTILEIGTSRDLGFCKSILKTGQLCSGWLNARRTEFCEFHTNDAIRKARGGRIELNREGLRGGSEYRQKSKEVWLAKKNERRDETERHFGKHDYASGSRYFVSGGGGRSAASLIDDRPESMGDTRQRAETLKRRLVAQEKEREIAKKLENMGRGAGRDYMSAAISSSRTTTSCISSTQATQAPKVDAASLGLLAPKGEGAAEIHLSPIKRKRPPNSSISSAGSAATLAGAVRGDKTASALGWGGSLQTKLGRMRQGESLNGVVAVAADQHTLDRHLSGGQSAPVNGRTASRSPVRKKTRFITEKGIREAGRESLGTELNAGVIGHDDDDDEVVIE